jgi:EamA domain-containing membrane protein RarD
MKLSHTQAVFLMVAVTLMWSIAGVITRHLEAARSFEVTFWRSFFTVLSLLVILPFFQGRAVFGKLRNARRRRCGCPACAGASCSPPSCWR